jgi:hypothetical protein
VGVWVCALTSQLLKISKNNHILTLWDEVGIMMLTLLLFGAAVFSLGKTKKIYNCTVSLLARRRLYVKMKSNKTEGEELKKKSLD